MSSGVDPKMINGLGNDIIEIKRIRQSIVRYGHHFMDRIFTPEEQEYCLKHKDSAISFAGRFAAKEAIAKALGTGIGAHLGWTDISVLNNGDGKPIVSLSAEAREHFSDPIIFVTISHCKEYASAVAIWQSGAGRTS